MKTTTSQTSPELVREALTRAAWRAGVLGAINVLTKVLAARFAVLVAVAGGIWLTQTALIDPDPFRLGALGIYSLAVVCPVVWLASR